MQIKQNYSLIQLPINQQQNLRILVNIQPYQRFILLKKCTKLKSEKDYLFN